MSSSSAERNPVERLAEEFAERHRRGERPALTEYTAKYPQHAEEIRDLFPALVMMEQLKPATGATGDYAPAPETAPLERLGDYRILREVGRGGMGVVYEAEQVSLGRHVALKVLPCQALSHPTFRERFQREARAAARLHHTNIVPVFGVGECDGVRYYAMQFIQGEGLDKVLGDLRQLRDRQGALPVGVVPTETLAPGSVLPGLLTGQFAQARAEEDSSAAGPEGSPPSASVSAASASPGSTFPGGRSDGEYCRSVARLGLQVAEALAYAHKQGIVHRDIKPSNLLLDQQGTVWVTDFGLAKAEGTDDLTNAGDIVGTVRFMAPERFSGQTLPQSDLYSLGLTLYELLTLRPAFEDTDRARLIERVLHEPPPSPRKLDRRIPRDLETIVLKAIAKDPAERFASAHALAEDLRRFLADRPIQARRTPWHERTWRWCRRNPVVATLSTAMLLLLTVTAVGGVVMSLWLNNALGQAQKDRDKAWEAERERKKQLFESLVAEAKAQRFSGRVGQRFGTLESIRKAAALARELEMPAATFYELRNLAIAALALPDMHLLKEWEGWPEGSREIVFDDTLERYARLDSQGNITVRRVADDAEIARRTGEGPTVDRIGFDEGGRALILHDSADTSRKHWRFDASESVLLGKHPALFAEDNSTIITAGRKLLVTLNRKNGNVGVHELASGKHLRDIRFGQWAAGAQNVASWVWDMHPRRHELAIALGAVWGDPDSETVRVLDLDRGTVQAELVLNPRKETGHIAWHPDGRTLAVAYTQFVVLWDVPTGKEVGRITDHKGGGLSVAVSRSGQLMSTCSHWAGGVKFWHPYTGKLLLSLPSMSIHPSAQTPDGRIYTYRTEGTRVQLWATEPSPVLRALVRGPSLKRVHEYRRSSVHRDGRLLAVGSSDGVSLFDLFSGLDVGHLDLGLTLTAQFDSATGDLLTQGTLGLLRWPIRAKPKDPDRLRIGLPKRLLATPAGDNVFCISRDGRTIAVAQYSRVLILHADQPDQPVILRISQDDRPRAHVRSQVSLSPDGRWVATGSHGLGDIHVWEARTGRLVKSLPLNSACRVEFAPDGERLLADPPGLFWRVGTWEEIPTTRGKISHGEFSPDSQLLASERGDGALRLLSPSTGRELAVLESPDQGRTGCSSFSPDGRFLIATNSDCMTVHVWDLHELRRLLKGMDLDWDAPPDPAAKERPARLLQPPLQVEIPDGLSGLAQKWQTAGQRNKEAWQLVTGAPEKRDPVRALKLIEQALQDDPDVSTFLNTLGVVQYRNGQYKQAMATLQKSLTASKGTSDAFDLFFLAMCHAKLGDKGKTKECFDRAVKWCDGRKGLPPQWVAELNAFRAEAEACLQAK
jgi:serine/threonine protein kinase/WD40 repeat protein